jgi:hypothetical protein
MGTDAISGCLNQSNRQPENKTAWCCAKRFFDGMDKVSGCLSVALGLKPAKKPPFPQKAA